MRVAVAIAVVILIASLTSRRSCARSRRGPSTPRGTGSGSRTGLSLLVTTPGVLAPDNPIGGLLMKDVLLLGAALFTAAEALDAAAMKRGRG